MKRIRFLVFLIVSLPVLVFAQQTEPRDPQRIKIESDSVALLFQADSTRFYLFGNGAWNSGEDAFLSIRKIASDYSVYYVGGKPHKKVRANYSASVIDEIKNVIQEVTTQPLYSEDRPSIEIKFQIFDTVYGFRYFSVWDMDDLVDKKIRKALSLD